MKPVTHISCFIFAVAIISFFAFAGCSTEKDAFLNRNFHAITAKNNILYNGKNALRDGREGLITSYKDDFWEVLPVERMEVVEEKALSGGAENPDFERAEEKAVKAIQKHGMNIRGRERNPKMDEAYMLLGIGRYYDQRFIPAMEAFNYVLDKYPDSDKYIQARIWREKTNIRMESEELALENLKTLLRSVEFKDQEYADACAMMAQAYINLQHRDSAIQRLKIAANLTKKNEEKGRYYYIIGQLYNALEIKDSANLAFDKVLALKRKSPRTYMINAELQKMRNTEIGDDGERTERLAFLGKMEKNRENRPFLDKIYHYISEFHLQSDSLGLAEEYLNKSLRANAGDGKLKAMCYEQLAEMNFNRNRYKDAGAYYDSTLTELKDDRRKIRAIRKKRDNLEDVIRYEDIVQVNDSILHLAALPESERQAYFEDYIEKLKEEDEKQREAEERAAENGTFDPFETSGNTGTGQQQNNEGGKFYFYNQVTLGHGKTTFRKVWGNRELKDNWRLADKSRVSRKEAEKNPEDIAAVAPDQRYDVNFYLDRLPTDAQVLDSLKTERDFANYQLGLIYKEKFREYPLAITKLETVLASEPEEKLVLPSKYHLFRLYEQVSSGKMAEAKDDIIKNHPGSRYAEILENPEAVLAGEADDPETYLTSLYKKFEAQEYESVLRETENYIKAHSGEEILPRMEMLRATCLGRLYGLEPYKEALNNIALNYPNDDVGKEAQKRLDESTVLENDAFNTEEAGRWKLVFSLPKNDVVGIGELIENVAFFSLKYPYYKNLKVSRDVYDADTVFVVVHGLRNGREAEDYRKLVNTDEECVIDIENFLILSPDYETVQVHKNVDVYKNKEITEEP